MDGLGSVLLCFDLVQIHRNSACIEDFILYLRGNSKVQLVIGLHV